MQNIGDAPADDGGGTVVLLGTGGTIAGVPDPRGGGYRAAVLGIEQLVAAVPELAGLPLQAEQLMQLDSKDMDFAAWQRLAVRLAYHLDRSDVAGVVVTHGSDTLEETAYFLQRVLAPAKPVVLTAAMRPAGATLSDGTQNLLDAVTVARSAGARGVVTVTAGDVLGAMDVRKLHTHRLHAFDAGDAGPVGRIASGRLQRWRDWPAGEALGLARLPADAARWPRVEIVTSHAGADGRIVRALLAQGLDGIVVAGTGGGTVNAPLEAALLQAQEAGVEVWRASRCALGPVAAGAGSPLPGAGELTAVQARIELMLALMPAD